MSNRIYYAVRGWQWYIFYTMVKSEMPKILAKLAEEARKKAMAEGLAKIEAMLAERVAAREAVEAIHGGLSAKKAELAGIIEGMGAVANADLEAIKAAEEAAVDADKKLKAFMAKGAKEKGKSLSSHSCGRPRLFSQSFRETTPTIKDYYTTVNSRYNGSEGTNEFCALLADCVIAKMIILTYLLCFLLCYILGV